MKDEIIENKKSRIFFLKHSKDFFTGFLVGSLILGILLIFLVYSKEHNFLTITWIVQRIILMGAAVGVGWMIGKWPLSSNAIKKVLLIGLIIPLGLLLLGVSIFYLEYSDFSWRFSSVMENLWK